MFIQIGNLESDGSVRKEEHSIFGMNSFGIEYFSFIGFLSAAKITKFSKFFHDGLTTPLTYQFVENLTTCTEIDEEFIKFYKQFKYWLCYAVSQHSNPVIRIIGR